MRIFKLLIDIPFLKKGSKFKFDDELGWIYAFLDGKWSEYPLRSGLAGYLWLLSTERKYMRKLKGE